MLINSFLCFICVLFVGEACCFDILEINVQNLTGSTLKSCIDGEGAKFQHNRTKVGSLEIPAGRNTALCVVFDGGVVGEQKILLKNNVNDCLFTIRAIIGSSTIKILPANADGGIMYKLYRSCNGGNRSPFVLALGAVAADVEVATLRQYQRRGAAQEYTLVE